MSEGLGVGRRTIDGSEAICTSGTEPIDTKRRKVTPVSVTGATPKREPRRFCCRTRSKYDRLGFDHRVEFDVKHRRTKLGHKSFQPSNHRVPRLTPYR